jgi:hypothetical protein
MRVWVLASLLLLASGVACQSSDGPDANGGPDAAAIDGAAGADGMATIDVGGATEAAGIFEPSCSGLLTGDGVVPTKAAACTSADPQVCFKTCGPEGIGNKSETCLVGAYIESGCTFLGNRDYACYKIPAANDAACPPAPLSGSDCTLPACTVCGYELPEIDVTGGTRIGYCVCPAPSPTTGLSKWSCALSTAWPCPSGQAC